MQEKSFVVIFKQYSKSLERKIFAENKRMNWPSLVICSLLSVLIELAFDKVAFKD